MLRCISPVVLPALFKHKLRIDEAPAGYINRQIESSMQRLSVTCLACAANNFLKEECSL